MSTFSVTERGAFKRCRRSWFWGSFNGEALTTAMPSTALNVGRIWHKGHELWSQRWPTIRPVDAEVPHLSDCMAEAYNGVLTEIADNLVAVGLHVVREGQLADWQIALQEQWTLLEAMAINYESFWGQPLQDDFIMIQPEQTVIVDVPNSPHKLEATLDGLAKNVHNGLAYVIEHKTYNSRPRQEDLQFGDQYLAYMWVLQRLGFAPGGVAYDGAWKRAAPPRGRAFEDLFLRFTMSRNQAEIDNFERFLPAELEEMEAARLDPCLQYPNHRWEGCWDCGAFRDRCHAFERGEDFDTSVFVPRLPGDREAVWPGGGVADGNKSE